MQRSYFSPSARVSLSKNFAPPSQRTGHVARIHRHVSLTQVSSFRVPVRVAFRLRETGSDRPEETPTESLDHSRDVLSRFVWPIHVRITCCTLSTNLSFYSFSGSVLSKVATAPYQSPDPRLRTRLRQTLVNVCPRKRGPRPFCSVISA